MPEAQREGERKLLLVQTLRAVAALMVVAEHLTNLLSQRMHLTSYIFSKGSAGVDIFFVISGLVMIVSSQSFAQKPHPARTFFQRRLERIVPLYWLATTLKLIIVFALPLLAADATPSLGRIIASYLFLPSTRGAPVFPALVEGWTLNYEMGFYILFACALFLRVPPLRVLLPTLGAIALIAFFAKPGAPGIIVYDDRIVLEFLYGVLLGMAIVADKIPAPLPSAILLILGFVPLFTLEPTLSFTRILVWGIPALAVVTGAVGLEQKLGHLIPAWLLEIGDASYAIYLFHGFALSAIGVALTHAGLGTTTTIALITILGFIASVLIGVVIHRIIEIPLATYFRRRRQNPMPAGA
jgi:peptidoglycan/LPS O-acetylase OafA/YrhL